MKVDFDLPSLMARITGRTESLFAEDLRGNEDILRRRIRGKSVVVIGGAGTIGSNFIRQLLPFEPAKVLVIDTNENELTELVRDLRSAPDILMPDEFVTLPMDFADPLAQRLLRDEGPFSVYANFAALKHVRSEKNAYCSAYMIKNNVLKARQLMNLLKDSPPERFFCVSTDKAAAPVNLMGASKKLMEELVVGFASFFPVTTARFANVAFSNGSLLDGFTKRLAKHQPLAAPTDVRRYFLSPEESGQLCLMACILGESGDIFVPRLDPDHDTTTFSAIAELILEQLGFTALLCKTEEEARQLSLRECGGNYPCFFFASDTTGEKTLEQFWTENEVVDRGRFRGVRVVRYATPVDAEVVLRTVDELERLFELPSFTKQQIVHVLQLRLSNFAHQETHKYLDERM